MAAVLLAGALLAAGCASSRPAAAPRPTAQSATGPAASAIPATGLRVLAAQYLAIAKPANHRLEISVDGYRAAEHHDLAAAEADLRAQAATEQRFDQQLGRIRFPPRIAAIARALIQANQIRIALTSEQARSVSVRRLQSFDRSHRAADAAVEVQVRAIRKALGLPPPETS
jgi:hypothetical protein